MNSQKQTLFIIFFLFSCNIICQNGGVWTWIHGDSTENLVGSFGTKGVPSPSNVPPARYHPAYWQDLEGNFWIFGNSSGTDLADMWRYQPSTNEWTWMNGSNVRAGSLGYYGVKGIPSPNNYPKNRGYGASCWVDSAGDLWMYAGSYCTDLWKYHIPTNEWTFVDGTNPNTGLQKSISYGIKNVYNASNFPGPRVECKSNWVHQGVLILYGGDAASDVWGYNISNNQWAWIGGSKLSVSSPIYGTMGVESPANIPKGGFSYCKWMYRDKLYLFGGAAGSDVWSYNLTSGNFTWELGSPSHSQVRVDPPSNCLHQKGYFPGDRLENHTVQSSACTRAYWCYGGFDAKFSKSLSDLWLYYMDSNYWIRVSNTNFPSYGMKSIPNMSNHPSGKAGFAMFVGADQSLYIYGGFKISNSRFIFSNDLWKFEPDPVCLGGIDIGGKALYPPSKRIICSNTDSVVLTIDSSLHHITCDPMTNVSFNSDTTRLVFKPNAYSLYKVTAQGGKCKPNDTLILPIRVGTHTNSVLFDTSCPYVKYNYDTSGIYYLKTKNYLGCDSNIELHLHITKSDSIILYYKYTLRDCSDSIVFRNQVYKYAGIYQFSVKSPQQCDTFFRIQIVHKLQVDSIIIDNICHIPKTITIYTRNYRVDSFSLDTGRHYQAFRGFFGLKAGKYLVRIKKPCGIIDTVVDIFDDKEIHQHTQATCTDYFFKNKKLKTSGTYYDTFLNIWGCDSIIKLDLFVNKHDTTLIDTTVCKNKPIVIMDSILNKSGNYEFLLYQDNGCDSLIKIRLISMPNPFKSFNVDICKGDSFLRFKSAGLYYDTIKVTGKCDSIAEYNLRVLDTTYSILNIALCPNETYTYNGNTYSKTGRFKHVFKNMNACDSFVYLDITKKKLPLYRFNVNICFGDSYRGHTVSGIYRDTLISYLGCDSVNEWILTVGESPIHWDTVIFDCQRIQFENRNYTSTTRLTDTIHNHFGCDSIYRAVDLIVEQTPKYQETLEKVFCDSIWMNGKLYRNTFTQVDTIKKISNQLGCDSLYRKTIYVMKRTPHIKILSTPDFEEYILGDMVTLSATPAYHYLWNTGDTNQSISAYMIEDREFRVTGWYDEECKDSNSLNLRVVEESLLDIPNAFAPLSSKNENRFFKPNIKGSVRIIHFDIYNRWGEKLYSSSNASDGWNGYYKGAEVPTGIYSYIIEYEANRRRYFKSGEVTLIR